MEIMDSATLNNMDEFLKYNVELKKPGSLEYMLYDLI